MGYRAALELAEIAKRYGLLGDSLVKNMLLEVCRDDNPEVLEEAEHYIGTRALGKIRRDYRKKAC